MNRFLPMKKSRRYVLYSLVAYHVGVVIVTLVFAEMFVPAI